MSKEQAIFLIKPDSQTREIAGHSLPKVIEGLLLAAGQEITQESLTQLSEQNVRDLYTILSIPTPKFGEQWKTDLINHLISEPVEAFLLEGEDAINRARTIKDYLRKTLCDQTTETGKIIKNIGHVPDDEDMEVSSKILFKK